MNQRSFLTLDFKWLGLEDGVLHADNDDQPETNCVLLEICAGENGTVKRVLTQGQAQVPGVSEHHSQNVTT